VGVVGSLYKRPRGGGGCDSITKRRKKITNVLDQKNLRFVWERGRELGDSKKKNLAGMGDKGFVF